MKNIEHKEQCALIEWANFQNLPDSNEKIGTYLVAIPNGGARSAVTGALLKAEGVRAGFPDLIFTYPTKNFHGLFIEMKAPTKTARVSEAQKVWLKRLSDVGYQTAVCYGFDEARNVIKSYLSG